MGQRIHFIGLLLLLGPLLRASESSSPQGQKGWWAFQPLSHAKPPFPSNRVDDRINPIDAFLLSKSAEKNLDFAPPATPRILARRASLILLGLPPAPAEITTFEEACQVNSRAAMRELTDQLLASPRYGERWARHWLDVARYAESSGFEHDYDREGAFHYRDFVIRAFNEDLPFDDFVRWQIAGDEFEPENPMALMATGFLGAGVFPTQITANEVERTRYDALDDMLSTTSAAFLGLTVGCARCHDHKYDPIPTRDYYRMLSTFTTTVRSVIDLDIAPEVTAEKTARWEAQRQPLATELTRYEAELLPNLDEKLTHNPTSITNPDWVLLDPTETKSEAGAKFTRQEDGSFLVTGSNAAHEQYTWTATNLQRRITAIRVEALADPSLPKGGPGRADNGNFALSKIRVFASPAGASAENEVRLTKATSDFEQNNSSLSVAASLDDQPSTGWAVDPQFGKDHAAVFEFAEPVLLNFGSALRVTMEFRVNAKHSIGRPRLAFSSEISPRLDGIAMPSPVAEALDLARGGRPMTSEQRTTVFDWWKRGDPGWRERQTRLAAHDKDRPVGTTKVLVCAEGYPALRMHTQGADFFKETYFLKRGNAELKDGIAEQGFLQVFSPQPSKAQKWQWAPPTGAQFSGRRRTLANWLTDVDQGAGALVARVIVNRVWQHHFGHGLVTTPNDFGKAGSKPSHPELLDWLAGELIRNHWHLKPLHRLIMSSAAWQQSGAGDPSKETADSANELVMRWMPRRLESEAIRDSLLAISGALDSTMYGPGTKDEASRRRSIYFTIKRSQLMGSMVAFDQPEPLVSQGVRPTTTVAPQALLLLNGPQVRAWAEQFASRLAHDASTTDGRISLAYSIAVSRPPKPLERDLAVQFIDQQTRNYAAEGNPAAAQLALSDFAQVMFGLNEVAYVE